MPSHYQIQLWAVVIWPLWTNFSEILIKIPNFSFTKMHLRIYFAKLWPFCIGGDNLKQVEPLDITPSPSYQMTRGGHWLSWARWIASRMTRTPWAIPKVLPKDPKAKYTIILVKQLQKLKYADDITELDYKRLHPTSTTIPQFYGLPKVHNAGSLSVPSWPS